MISQSKSWIDSQWGRGVFVACCLFVVSLLTGVTRGEEPVGRSLAEGGPVPARTSQPTNTSERQTAKGVPTSTSDQVGPGHESEDNSQRERQKQIAIGLFLLVGIALAWMIGFAIIWGLRTRRIMRQPLPPAPRGDELWFLKKPMPSSPPATGADQANVPGGDSSGGPAVEPPPPATPPNRDQPR